MKLGRRLIAIVAGTMALALTAGAGAAMAHEGGHGHEMWLLARAAGITHDQIVTAFTNDSNIATDRTNLGSARDAMMTCIVSGGSCSNEISAYSSAQQAMTQEKMTVWQSLFKQAPNSGQAATVLGELQQLRTTRKQIFQQVFGGAQGGSRSPAANISPAAVNTPSAPAE